MPMPIYPEKALRERVRGVVVLRVLVSQNGEPLEVTVERAARKDLTDAAVAAVKQWRFEPARKGGYRVRGYTRVRFPFEGVQFARTPLPGFAATPAP
jgi:protein TonB